MRDTRNPPPDRVSIAAMSDAIPAQSPALPEGYRKPSHGRGALKPWKKGQSGNTTVVQSDYRDVLQLARKHSPEAMKRMVALMDSKDDRVALMAADKVLERAWGRVKEVDPAADRDPEATERRAQMRAEVIRMLQALAVPEPLTVDNAVVVPPEDEAADQGERSP